MSKVITLAQYREIEVTVKGKNPVTDEAVDQQIAAMMQQQTSLVDKEGKVEISDVTTIDFEGFKDGVPFDGGKAEGYQLEIGSHQFIPGFEEQMIGMEKGETKDLNLTFPENYPAEELAGAAVIFKVTVHNIQTKQQASLTDEFIASLNIPEITTVDAFKQYTRDYLESQEERKFTTDKENKIFDTLIENSEVNLEDADIKKALESHIAHIEMDVRQQGVTLEQYLAMYQMTREDLEKQLNEPAIQQAKFEAIIDEIVNLENIATSIEEAQQQAEIMAQNNGMKKEDILDKIKLEDLQHDFDRLKASQIILSSAKIIVE